MLSVIGFLPVGKIQNCVSADIGYWISSTSYGVTRRNNIVIVAYIKVQMSKRSTAIIMCRLILKSGSQHVRTKLVANLYRTCTEPKISGWGEVRVHCCTWTHFEAHVHPSGARFNFSAPGAPLPLHSLYPLTHSHTVISLLCPKFVD